MSLRRPAPLALALGLSVAVHAALLGLHVAGPAFADRAPGKSEPLEIILVNAATAEAPRQALAVAQKAVAGGGAAERGRATSPLPRTVHDAEGDALEDARRQSEAAEAAPEEAPPLLATLARDGPVAVPAPSPPRTEPPTTPLPASEAVEREDRQRQLVSQLAEIERSLNRDNARPRKRYVGPSTREAAYAGYVDSLRRRIEARGTSNFPEVDGQKLYGELTMLVTVDAEGRLLGAEILQGSGNDLLDRRAQAIVRSIGGFGRFSDAMRQQADQIVLPSRFRFGRDETLQATR
jgi:protein TonB